MVDKYNKPSMECTTVFKYLVSLECIGEFMPLVFKDLRFNQLHNIGNQTVQNRLTKVSSYENLLLRLLILLIPTTRGTCRREDNSS